MSAQTSDQIGPAEKRLREIISERQPNLSKNQRRVHLADLQAVVDEMDELRIAQRIQMLTSPPGIPAHLQMMAQGAAQEAPAVVAAVLSAPERLSFERSDLTPYDVELIASRHGHGAKLRPEAGGRYYLKAQVDFRLMAIGKKIQALLEHCKDAECSQCGIIMCPEADPYHFHHDGCPSCSQPEDKAERMSAKILGDQ